ncbi:DNA-directed RNA polymerase sigma-70 factor [Marivirga tractuosa]|uniref:RNA polymerase, sigma-24 subunit, ECF subfamily n=1 Tax=Marivirga tractuosa (strain ATCC 23168 / DSM 4126 / NBRC 15989 / NCIMB 1408 / VKM B-1430 / H-43) TaxID=643867 RepID=E4TNK9_MARTH|nr:sigma-70 family RNA polymerase sigma factor [Marivirga tractuosa]ADR21446.1 RNA polymerase, sigma-24 subunit, ECF subfamily [Marivirga tractuosa DSM 4126]BDD14100.1 DNA-directed RNA polymerase sigma-70 factor [Marivirga tractuosa]
MENKAYKELLNENKLIISKICRAYSNDSAEFEDYFQEVAIQLWKAYNNYKGEAKISTWVYRISLNVCLTQVRKKNRQIVTSSLNLAYDHISEEDIAGQDQLDKLYDAIRSLKKMDRAIILLYLEEKKYKEMAEILGINISNIGVKVNRIKKELKEKLNG